MSIIYRYCNCHGYYFFDYIRSGGFGGSSLACTGRPSDSFLRCRLHPYCINWVCHGLDGPPNGVFCQTFRLSSCEWSILHVCVHMRTEIMRRISTIGDESDPDWAELIHHDIKLFSASARSSFHSCRSSRKGLYCDRSQHRYWSSDCAALVVDGSHCRYCMQVGSFANVKI